MKVHWKQWMISSLFACCCVFFLNVESIYASTFIDVSENHPSAVEIEFLADLGIIKGYQDKTFKPSNNVTRSQVAIMITRAFELDINNRPDLGFRDLTKIDKETKNAIAAVVDEGIFPKEGNQFRPNEPITRGEMAQVLVNAFELSGTTHIEFKDVPKTYKHYNAINILAANKITTGYEDGTFKPSEPLTRAHFSTFMSRAIYPDFIPVTTGYGYNKNYNYVYRVYVEDEVLEDYFTYLKTEQRGDLWAVTDEAGYGITYVNIVDSKGFRFIGFNEEDEKEIIDFSIPFPVKLGSKWSYSNMDLYEPIDYYVTSMSETKKTPAGTFKNLIEIVSSDGYVFYYSPEYGHISIVDLETDEVVYELVRLEKR